MLLRFVQHGCLLLGAIGLTACQRPAPPVLSPIEVLLASAPGEVAGLVVRLESGSPIAGAQILIGEPDAIRMSATTQTDSAGEFRVQLQRPGPYLLRVRKFNFAARVLPIVLEEGRGLVVVVSLDTVQLCCVRP